MSLTGNSSAASRHFEPASSFARVRSSRPVGPAHFGKVEAMVNRQGVKITPDDAVFPGWSFRSSEIKRVQLLKQDGPLDLAWLLYGAIAVVTFAQAAITKEIGLWALAAALGALSGLAWRRRQPSHKYDVVIEGPQGLTPVFTTQDQSFATLIYDAVAAMRKPAGTQRRTL